LALPTEEAEGRAPVRGIGASNEESLDSEPEDGALNMLLDVLVQRRALPDQAAPTTLVSGEAFAKGIKVDG